MGQVDRLIAGSYFLVVAFVQSVDEIVLLHISRTFLFVHYFEYVFFVITYKTLIVL